MKAKRRRLALAPSGNASGPVVVSARSQDRQRERRILGTRGHRHPRTKQTLVLLIRHTPWLVQLPISPPKHCVVPHPITALELSKRQARPGSEPQGNGSSPSVPAPSLWCCSNPLPAVGGGRQLPSPPLPRPSRPAARCKHQELLPQRKQGQMETSSLAPVMALGREPCQPMCKLHVVWPSSACRIAGRSDRPPELPSGEKQRRGSMDRTGYACPLPRPVWQPRSAPYRSCARHTLKGRGREPPVPRRQGMNPTIPAVGAPLPWHTLRCLERPELASSLPSCTLLTHPQAFFPESWGLARCRLFTRRKSRTLLSLDSCC